MPASSRKRNKGKDRKAKQLAKKEESERAYANGFWRSRATCGECDHGCKVAISNDHPVSSFMDQYCMNMGEKSMVVSQALRELFKSHPQIWNNEGYRKLVIDVLIRFGTNLLLGEGSNRNPSVCIATSIVVLEHFNGDTDDIDSIISKQVVTSKWRDLQPDLSSSNRDALKFFRKRTTCKCLKKMHLEARKTIPKMGKCRHCKEEMDRELLHVCGRCMVEQYCSRECQVANWPEHWEVCDVLY